MLKKMTILSTLTLALALISCGGGESDRTIPGQTAEAPSDIMQTVKPGIEVLRDQGFAPLKGKRVGLITNPTGIDSHLKSTIDILAEAPEVKLTALFAPEHGVRGDHVAGASVADSTDPKTGVRVYSLHGSVKKPTAEMLKDVDILVYDIQDIGCRSYTFISTMGLAMEACAQNGKEFMVLDRPNPLGGERVEGPLVIPSCISFVSRYPVPYIYGLTPGELARTLNGEGMLSGGRRAELTVIPMEGWRRDMTFRETGLPWVLPSPHIPYPETAMLYPATGIMGELDYVSIGVGYTLPFQLAGASWIDAGALADALNGAGIEGVEFRPIHFKPFYAFGRGEQMGGVQVYITDPGSAVLSLVQFEIMEQLARLYPAHKPFASSANARLNMFDKVCGTPEVRRLFSRQFRTDDIRALWMDDALKFRTATEKYRLYR